MRLGTRWTSGSTPPNAVPPELAIAVTQIDEQVRADGVDPLPRWTLTWLEGRPYAELDGGVIITIDEHGNTRTVDDID